VHISASSTRYHRSMIRHCEEAKPTKQSRIRSVGSGLLRCARNDVAEASISKSVARLDRATLSPLDFDGWTARGPFGLERGLPTASLVKLIHLLSIEGVRPRQAGILPSIDRASSCVRPLRCEVAFKSIDHRIHVLETGFGE